MADAALDSNSSTIMMNRTKNLTEECMWCLNEELIGPLIAFFTAIILIFSLITNLFICIYTLSHPKSLKKSSTMFLLNLALINLLMTVFFMPFMVVASAAEEWIIGRSDTERDVLCQITAFLFAYTVGISVHTLAAISFDRFLSIVKPHHHKKYMTWKVALGIVIFLWIYSIFVDITPFFGLGEYAWSGAVGTCVPVWAGHTDYVIFFSVLSTIPFTIIIVTTLWTYIFTKRFIRKDFERRKTMTQNELEQQKHEKSVYNVRIRNLVGVFGMLLLFNVVTFSPYITASLIGLIVGLNNIPSEIYATVLILFLLNNVTNSIIQSYFRRDLRDCIYNFLMKSSYHLSHICCKFHYKCEDTESRAERDMPSVHPSDSGKEKSDTIQKSKTYSYERDISLVPIVVERPAEQHTVVTMDTLVTVADDQSSQRTSDGHSLNSLLSIDKEPQTDDSNYNGSVI